MVRPKPIQTAPRIALFGGSFDPPHRGHLAIARAAADSLQLKEVLFAPTALQPLKPGGAHASYLDRLAMVTRACQRDSRFTPSTLDAPRGDNRPNYTVDALSVLHQQSPEAELFAIVGADAFLDVPRWYQAARLFELAQWIVVSRPGFDLDTSTQLNLHPEERRRIHFIQTVHDDVSATELRQRLAAGDLCPGLLPEAVSVYIQQHHLYQAPQS